MRYDGADHVVVALAGTSVRLRSEDGSERVVLAGHLMACLEFEVAGGGRLPQVEPSGLLEGLPARVLERAREWERHVVEAQAGLPAGAVPRPCFDPAATTVGGRDRAKAAELGVSPRVWPWPDSACSARRRTRRSTGRPGRATPLPRPILRLGRA